MAGVATKKQKLTHIQGFVRIRPTIDQDGPSAITWCTPKEISIKGYTRRFAFDQIFDDKNNQVSVYKTVVGKMIPDVLKGYNCTIFAYGQTGTGKTYTILGNNDLDSVDINFQWQQDSGAGIIQRAAVHIYEELNKMDTSIQRTVTVSFMEIYNEEIRDLLCDKQLTSLRIYEDKTKSVRVKNLQEVTVLNAKEIFHLLKKGCERRQVAATLMNDHSSRSHTVFTITVSTVQTVSVAGNISNITCGKLNLIDLAGSENIARSGSKDQRQREASNINQSLLTLGRVIKALVENSSHVPYRESKLTRILQDSLGGKAKTSIIATISPGVHSLDETMNTLDYAHNARNVTNCPTINLRTSEYAAAINEELIKLKRDLFATANADGVYMDKDNYEEMTESLTRYKQDIISKHDTIRLLSEQVEDLTSQKDEWQKLQESFEKTRLAFQQSQTENQIHKSTIQKDNMLLRHYEAESEKLQNYVDMMATRENHLHQKVDSLYAASKKNQNVMENIVQTMAKTMDSLLTKDYDHCQEITETISRLTEFNNKVNLMFKNVINEMNVKLQARANIGQPGAQSNDSFSVHINEMHETVDNLEIVIDSHRKKMEDMNKNELRQTVIQDLERTTLSKVQQKQCEMENSYDEQNRNYKELSCQMNEENNIFNSFLDIENEEISFLQEKLKERQERLKYLKEKREELSLVNKMKKVVDKHQGNKQKMLDLTALQQNTFSSAINEIKQIEEKTVQTFKTSVNWMSDKITENVARMRSQILKVVTCVMTENSEGFDVLNQISNILDVEGKAHLEELRQMVNSHSELISNTGMEGTHHVNQILESSIVPVARTGDTPQRLELPPTRRLTRDSLLRKLQTDFPDTENHH